MNMISINSQGKWKRFYLLLSVMMLTVLGFGQVRISGKITSPSGASR